MWRIALVLLLVLRVADAKEPVAPKCDAQALEKQGDDAWKNGLEERALAFYEQALKCKVTDAALVKAGLSSCKLYKRTSSELYLKKAKGYWERVPPAKKHQLEEACTPSCKLQ